MMRRDARAWLCGIALLILPACGKTATQPSGSVTGTWTGALPGLSTDVGVVRLVLAQSGAAVTGTFTTTFPNASTNQSGSAGGTLQGSVLTLALTPSAPLVCSASLTLTGTLTFTFTLTNGTDRLTGTYSGFTCGGSVGAGVELDRQ